MSINLSIKAKNFKSIGEVEVGFDSIYPINILIGRNNTGKSTLLELVGCVINPSELSRYNHAGKNSEIFLTKLIVETEIKQTFPSNTSGGSIGMNHFDYGMKWLDKPLTIRLRPNGSSEYIKTDPEMKEAGRYRATLGEVFYNFFKNKVYRRVLADRDIRPEPNDKINVLENGQGVTNVIQHYYIKASRDKSVITKKLLNALNEIFNPDAMFSDISVREENNMWEIYIEEDRKGSIPLSRSGSGLKTVIIVLVNLLIMPLVNNRPISEHIFAFEELENNLHPGLQRRLFSYIRKLVLEEKTHVFITTHSNVVIDMFNKDQDAQIIHVSHDGEVTSMKKVTTYIDNKGILDDLDVRASDLLQSNCVIWVEGPSDRLYVNKWIDLWSNSSLKEGVHYQCVFYGGRLLAHLSALQEEAREQKGVDILRVNRNAILILDSDKNKEEDVLNHTKKRMITEIESVSGYSWITDGREIENYISNELLNSLYSTSVFPPLPKFSKLSNYLNIYSAGKGDIYLDSKVLFAENTLPLFTLEYITSNPDLKNHIEKICNLIKKWNSIS